MCRSNVAQLCYKITFEHRCQIGRLTNVVYYSYFDTAVNQFLIERGVLDIHNGEVVGFVVDSGCSYFSSIIFPDTNGSWMIDERLYIQLGGPVRHAWRETAFDENAGSRVAGELGSWSARVQR